MPDLLGKMQPLLARKQLGEFGHVARQRRLAGHGGATRDRCGYRPAFELARELTGIGQLRGMNHAQQCHFACFYRERGAADFVMALEQQLP